MGKSHGIGIVGLGVISRAYLETLVKHPRLTLVAVADLDPERARATAENTGASALGVDEMLRHPDVDTVLNLTIPAAHAEVALAAIGQGKDVYGEKPLATTLADGRSILAAATAAGVRVGSAPDTVLGTGTQTARAAVDSGAIGRPVSATATWFAPGHEAWHPNPDFYYAPGGGPLLDMGPYYITSLVQILGPVVSATGASSRLRPRRVIATGPRVGEEIPVTVDTHVTGILEHASGALSTVTMSFDGVRTEANPIEIHGESGSLSVPDPNMFDGEVRLFGIGDESWTVLPPSAGFVDGSRGAGLIDFALGDRDAPLASGALGLHVLEVMTAILDSAQSGRRITVESQVERPPLVPLTPSSQWLS
ncbi:Gfo/Idh/MocA family oxidoreductase [Herbiconiux sp. CPCC 205763]|uniref:Gfo/Idh/MocA family oxidoreductase n=1 Tax=Herbiconiux aconitum TaxID=2970913 RepID=A0ABT2GM54_9MICO|nr:Gfo/Idh/MocA family oxidoreductase [Herbiconiux aconitum]MCS5717201.1 Gfo/Idh/MocA family oxidoreductase [Herbiconiux aconitum]